MGRTQMASFPYLLTLPVSAAMPTLELARGTAMTRAWGTPPSGTPRQQFCRPTWLGNRGRCRRRTTQQPRARHSHSSSAPSSRRPLCLALAKNRQ